VRLLGGRGEDLAARFLARKGLKVLERNFRCPAGEVDIIARDGETVVFVEVKTRRGGLFGHPLEAVHSTKRDRLRKTALFYLSTRGGEAPARFDIVGINLGPGAPEIEHVEDAFGL